MKTYTYWVVIPVTLLAMACVISGNRSSADAVLRRLHSNSPCEVRAAFLALHDNGRERIPALIDEIANAATANVSLMNPRNSMITEAELSVSSGIVAAYAIELILGRPTLRTRPNTVCSFPLEWEDYLYQSGVIYETSGNAVEMRMDRVQAVYRHWWAANHHKSLSQLQEEWKNGKGPLTGSGLRWR